MRMSKLPVIVATGALALAACGGAEYSRQDAIDDFVETGMDETTATCIVDGIEANFSVARLESTGELTEEEESVLLDITSECVLGGLGG